jgi:hypothetical protein
MTVSIKNTLDRNAIMLSVAINVTEFSMLSVIMLSVVAPYSQRSFSSSVKIGSNKLECYIILEWNDLPGTNTLAYWANL